MTKTNKSTPWLQIAGAVGIILFAGSGRVHGTHNHIEFDFESSDTSGWSSDTTSSHLFGTGTYLGSFGANESASLAIMDALPAQLGMTGITDTSSRLVILTFDIVNPSSSAYDNFSVQANAKLVSNQIAIPTTSTSVTTTFILDANGSEATDLLLAFYHTGEVSPQGWGIDNVTVDWSREVPEPGTGLCFLVTAAPLCFCWRRRTSFARQDGHPNPLPTERCWQR